MKMKLLSAAGLGLMAVVLCGPAVAEPQASDADVVVVLTDGSSLVGRIVQEDAERLKIHTRAGADVEVPRSGVVSISRGSGRPILGDPNYSRLMFAPTGRPLRKGDGYFSDHYVLFPGFGYGLTDNVSIAAGVSVVPGLGLREQLFYVAPKVGGHLSDRVWLSAGFLYARAGDAGDDDHLDNGLGFVVATHERSKGGVSVGLGLTRTTEERYVQAVGYRKESKYAPILMLGGKVVIAKRLALVSENWLILDDVDLADQPFGVSLRFFGDRLSADVGVILVGEVLKEGFPIPWLSFSYHFGPAPNGHRPAVPLR